MTAMAGPQDLAVVIPVWNLPEDLSALLAQIAGMGVFAQVIVSDDASDPACHPETLGFDADRLGAEVIYLRSDEQRGAGHARNLGLGAVTAGHVIFFDADDLFAPGFAEIWARHRDGAAADFTIFRHTDSRVREGELREGSFLPEEALWDAAMDAAVPEAAGGPVIEAMLDPLARATLSGISNYPWNKIYRTDFLRDHGIDCSETPVHNDIRLHWLSFAHARHVRAIRTIGAVHVVGGRGHHLTTRRGDERLCLDGILERLTADLRAAPGNTRQMRHFIQFVDNVCQWNIRQVDDALVPQFTALARNAYLRFTADEFRMYARWQPEKAERIVEFLLAQGA